MEPLSHFIWSRKLHLNLCHMTRDYISPAHVTSWNMTKLMQPSKTIAFKKSSRHNVIMLNVLFSINIFLGALNKQHLISSCDE